MDVAATHAGLGEQLRRDRHPLRDEVADLVELEPGIADNMDTHETQPATGPATRNSADFRCHSRLIRKNPHPQFYGAFRCRCRWRLPCAAITGSTPSSAPDVPRWDSHP